MKIKNIQINELYFVKDWNDYAELVWVEERLDNGVYKCRKMRNVGESYEPNKDDTPYLVCKDRFLIKLNDWVLNTYNKL